MASCKMSWHLGLAEPLSCTRSLPAHGILDVVLHDGKDNVSLVSDGCKSHRCDHHDHEVECLDLFSLRANMISEPKAMKYIPNWQMSTTHLPVHEYAGVRSQRDTAKSCRAIQLRRKC